jgi:PEP-CTERM motif
MRFRNKLALIAAATLGLGALPAQAAVQVTTYQYSPPAIGGGLAVASANFSEYGAAGRFLSTIQDLATLSSLDRYTFCIDVLSGYYTYQPFDDVTLSSMFSNPTQQAALAGLLTYANPTIDGAGATSNMSLSAAAFSLAIWEVVHETSSTYDLTAGNFSAYGDLSAAGSLANTYLARVQSGQWSGNVNNVRVLRNAGNGVNQNQIYLASAGGGAVPEPSTWAMLLGGFAMVGAAMRRRAQPVLRFAKA